MTVVMLITGSWSIDADKCLTNHIRTVLTSHKVSTFTLTHSAFMIRSWYYILLTLMVSPVNGQWYQIPSPYAGYLRCIAFFDEHVGFIGGNSSLIKSVDSGVTWSVAANNTPTYNSFSFPSETTGYFCTQDGQIGKTTDQGSTWTNVYITETGTALYDIFFVDDNIGYAVGENGMIVKTLDGGDNWVVLYADVNGAGLHAVYFTDPLTGVIAASYNTILRTIDGGALWQVMVLDGIGSGLSDVVFADSDNGLIVGSNGAIARTVDGGATWTSIPSGTVQPFYGVSCKNENEWLVVGAGSTIHRTLDGGTTWTTETANMIWTPQLVRDVISKDGSFIAVGEAGKIITDSPAVGYDEAQSSTIMFMVPNPAEDRLAIFFRDDIHFSNITISDLKGTQVLSKTLNSGQAQIDVSHLNPGLYIVHVKAGEQAWQQKLVVVH